ncbi:MAG: glutamate-1-semialdehyde 2,1-aminomutase [Rhodospirillaceae bacterium]|nr:glutamate-1-semialdehyde 2,1-aminomutase [Rhodospirillaceae bacterium]MDE0359920.1 glutamate-1-semialdehyde 2,1-aminomutase [Rhodospirillaceae bacterium]
MSEERTATKSTQWFDRAIEVLPGGVSSPVRAFRSVGGTPPVIQKGDGAHVVDMDGNRYLDFVGSWGPLILGHANRHVVKAVADAVNRGMSFGAPSAVEIELAEEIVASYPGIEQVRFVSSGTEAVMSAVRLARGATGRDIIVKFSGCYHGHVDHLLVAAGSGLATFGTPSSQGVPEPIAGLTRVLPLDDDSALAALFDQDGDRIAATIIEPVPANNGLLLQRPRFLATLRELCTRHGALLIFDEVISGFRLGPGGAAAHYGVQPDLATFGKVIGGGMPVGAFGAPRNIMQHLAPTGGVYQAGTLSGNPVAMTAGLTTLKYLRRYDCWEGLEELGQYLKQRLGSILNRSPVPAAVVRIGSIFWIAWGSNAAPTSAEAIHPDAARIYRGVFHGLLERGIALAPSAYEVGFLSLAHTPEHIDRLATALGEVLDGLDSDSASMDHADDEPEGSES